MKHRKVSKILSILLAVAMVASMIPIGASAAQANTPGFGDDVDTSKDYVDFQIMASTKLYDASNTPHKENSNGDNAWMMQLYANVADAASSDDSSGYDFGLAKLQELNPNGVANPAADMTWELNRTDPVESATNQATLEAYKTLANRLFQDETAKGTKALEVEAGSTFYLGFKAEPHLVNMKGLSFISAFIGMDMDTFSVSTESSPPKVSAVMNNMQSGGGYNNRYKSANLKSVKNYRKYAGALKEGKSSPTLAIDDSTDNSGFGFNLDNTAEVYMGTETTWDVVVEVKVDANATPGDYQIGPSNNDQKELTVGWASVDPDSATSGEISASPIGATHSLQTLKANAIQVKVVKRSAAPEETDPVKYTITDVKNLPYVAKPAGESYTPTELAAMNDTIEIPANSGFKGGDMVVLYADKDHKVELGRTVLNDTTVVEGGTVTAGSEVGPNTFRLSQTTVTVPEVSEGETPTVTLDTANAGVCYLKGEKTVYLARVEKDNIGKAGVEPSSAEIAVSVTSTDTPIYYHGNVSLLGANADGSSAEKPLQVTFGTPLEDVLTQLNTALSGNVNAPVEDGTVDAYEAGATVSKTVSTSLVTSEATVRNYIQDALAVDTKTGKYYIAQHGALELLFPYQDASDADHVYKQPAAHSSGTAPVYGAKVYLTVVPNVTEYAFVSNGVSETLEILGKTKEHFENGADTISMYLDDGGKPAANATTSFNTFATNPATDGDIPAAGTTVWITYKEKDKAASKAVSTVVTDGTLQIAQDIVFNKSTGEDPTVYQVQAGTSLETILGEILPIDIPLTGSEKMGRAKKEDAALLAQSLDKTESEAGESKTKYEKYNNDSKAFELSSDTAFGSTVNGDKWKITMPISDYMLSFLVKNTLTDGLADGYKNEKGYGFVLTLSVVDSVKMDKAEDGSYTFTTIANNPLGTDDEFTLAGVVKHDNNAVVGDQVLVYDHPTSTDASHQVGVGTVTAIDATNTFTCKVSQIGRDAGEKVYLYFRHFGLLDMKTPIEVTLDKDEDYTFFGLSTYANPLKLEGTYADTEAIYAAVSAPVMKYGYFVKKDGSIQADDTATFSRTLSNTPDTTYAWTDGYTDGDDLGGYFDGESANKSTLTLDATAVAAMKSAAADGAKDNVPIVFTAAYPQSVETCIKINAQPLQETTVNAIDPQVSVTNNAYPKLDKITVKKGTGYDNITVRVYPTEADATAKQNEIMNFTTGSMSGAADDLDTNLVKSGATELVNRAILGTGAGSVWVTYENADSTASAPKQKTYTTEPFIVWSSSINPAASDPINVKIIDPESPTDGKDVLQRLQAKLPTKMYANAEHLDGTAPGYTTVAADKKAVEVTIDKWYTDDGTELELADVTDAIAKAKDADSVTKSANLSLTAAFETDPTSVTLDSGKVNILSADDLNDLGVTRDANYNKTAYTVTLTADNEIASDTAMTLPEDATEITDHIKPVIGDRNDTEDKKYTVNDGIPTNDAIELDFSSLVATYGDLKGATAEITYTAPSPTGSTTVTGTVDETTGKLTLVAPTQFAGFDPTQDTTMSVTFKKAGMAASDAYEVTAAGKASSLKIESVESPMTLNLSVGTVSSVTDLQDLLNGKDDANVSVANVTVAFDSTDVTSGTMPLAATDGTVTWTLKTKGTATAQEIADGDGTNLADLGAETPDFNTASTDKYYMVASIDTTGGYTPEGQAKIDVEGTTNLLAIVPIKLYNDNDNPMQLTPGNNDLWLHGLDAGTPANTTLTKLTGKESPTEDELKAVQEDYKNSLVFWYRYEDRTIVAGWENEDSVSKLGSTEFGEGKTAFADWQTGAENRSISYKELNADLTEINNTITTSAGGTTALTSINPQHVTPITGGEDAKEYFERKANGTHRGVEEYKILYTVRDGKEVYVGKRNVKLTYKCGDANLDGAISVLDANIAIQYPLNLTEPFQKEDGSRDEEMSLLILDLDGNGSTGVLDGNFMQQIPLELSTYPYHRY